MKKEKAALHYEQILGKATFPGTAGSWDPGTAHR